MYMKTKNKKKANCIVIILLSIVLLSSCQNDLNDNFSATSTLNDKRTFKSKSISKRTWSEQFEFVKECPNKALITNKIKLIDYSKIGKIDKNNLSEIKTMVSSEDNYVAICSNNLEKIDIKRISDVKMDKSIEFNNNKHTELLGQSIFEGVNVLKLKWKVGNNTIFSYCLVSDTQGILYDNMLSNIIIVAVNDYAKIDTVSEGMKKNKISKRFKVDSNEGPKLTLTLVSTRTFWRTYNCEALSGNTYGTGQLSYQVDCTEKQYTDGTRTKALTGAHDLNCTASIINGSGYKDVLMHLTDNNASRVQIDYAIGWCIEGSFTTSWGASGGYTFTNSSTYKYGVKYALPLITDIGDF